MEKVFESIDRMVTTEIRLSYMVRGIIPKLYEAAKGDQPISQAISEAIVKLLRTGKNRFAIITGFYSADFLPKGESDGPLGAVVLARALELLGAEVILLVEKEMPESVGALCRHLQLGCRIRPLSRDSDSENAQFADQLDAAIFIEKCGPSKEEVYHFATGRARYGEDAPLKTFLDRMNASGKLTVGIGDFGNEIGFGKIFDAARQIVDPYGSRCKCPKNEGIITYYETRYLLPASVSNIGAYGLAAALALLTGRLDVLHTPEREIELIRIGTREGLVDGGYGKVHDYIDGLPAATIAAVVEILRAMPTLYHDRDRRDF